MDGLFSCRSEKLLSRSVVSHSVFISCTFWMILSDIKKYLQQRGQATLADIANHFHAEPEAVRGMIEYWQRKGKVARTMANADCGSSCSKCDVAATEIYHWLDSNHSITEQPIRFIPPNCDQH